MYSTTLISTNYALNYGLWLCQALLNCEMQKLVKKLKTLSIWLPPAHLRRQTVYPSFFHKRERKEQLQLELAGCGQERDAEEAVSFLLSLHT